VISAGVAFGVAVALGSAMRWFGPRLGVKDVADGGQPTPQGLAVSRLGGVAVAGGLAAGLAVEGWPLPWGASVALAGAFALGLADDAIAVPPFARVGVQVGLGAVLAAGGLAADAMPGTASAWLVAIVLLVAAMNAVNRVDGMDGLAGGSAALSALGIAVAAARAGHDGAMVLALLTAAAALGFLAYNLPPARLFLGHNGAYLLGAALAVAVLAQGHTVAELLGAATCIGLGFLDLLLTLLRRVVGGAPIAGADRGHLYEQLRARGLTPWRTLAVCWIVHVALVAVGVQISRANTSVAVITAAVAWLVVAGWLLWSGLVTPGGSPA
jgi:UDP-GlcNAc:undecaprenyl-phosphate GlcNAc-1-phosphate transferase